LENTHYAWKEVVMLGKLSMLAKNMLCLESTHCAWKEHALLEKH
jgi:hypothetical protein